VKTFYTCKHCDTRCKTCKGQGEYIPAEDKFNLGEVGDSAKCTSCGASYPFFYDAPDWTCDVQCNSGYYEKSLVIDNWTCGKCKTPCGRCRKCYTSDLTDINGVDQKKDPFCNLPAVPQGEDPSAEFCTGCSQ
jgi:hypothetical protein